MRKISEATNIPRATVSRILNRTRPEDDEKVKRGPESTFSAAQQAKVIGIVVFMISCGIGMTTNDIWNLFLQFYMLANCLDVAPAKFITQKARI